MQEEIIVELLKINKDLTDQIVALSREIAKMGAPIIEHPMEASPIPLHTPETEEDANFLLNNGMIDKNEYENILKELQFYSSDIVVPSSS